MMIEAALALCLTNTTDAAVLGQVRDGRSKTTSAKLSGTSLTYREPVFQTAFPKVEAGQTACAEIASDLVKPQLIVWSARPSHVLANGREDDATCRLPKTLPADRKIAFAFAYRKGLLGKGQCREIR